MTKTRILLELETNGIKNLQSLITKVENRASDVFTSAGSVVKSCQASLLVSYDNGGLAVESLTPLANTQALERE